MAKPYLLTFFTSLGLLMGCQPPHQDQVTDLKKMINDLDTLYYDLYAFTASLYNPEVGGFHESPAHFTPPRIESTARVLNILDKGD